jgi:transposase
MLEDFRRSTAESELRFLRQRGLEKACASPDLEVFRRPSPEKVQAAVKALLTIPREPVMNPCL